MSNFDFLGKGLEILCIIFQEKCISYYTLLTDQISLSDCLYSLRYLAICVNATVCSPDCDVIDFEINLVLLIKPFFYMTKKSKQKCKYLENEKNF